jgi:acyl carrier protein
VIDKADIRTFILKNFYVADEATLKDETSLLDRGIVDSTGVLEVVTFLEEKYGVRVADEEMLPDNFDSIARIAAYLGRKLGTP